MAILSYALTTVARVKARLNIPSATTTWDALLAELINGATGYMEGECGRRFKTTTYTSEIYSLDAGQRLLTLRQWPVTAISAAQYRAGFVSNPSWTAFLTDDYELVGDGKLGVIKLYIALAGNIGGINALRFTYTAGYVIDFTTEANHLPYELSDLCERLAAWAFKKREAEGKQTESAAEASVTWRAGVSDDDKHILRSYIRSAFL